jgi:hypothetical protein
MLPLGGLQVKHVMKRGIWVPTDCSETKENHGRPWSSWLVAGPSGYKLTGIKYMSPNISSYLCFFYSFLFDNIYNLFLQTFLCVYNSDKHQTMYNTRRKEWTHICLQIYMWFFDYR